MRLLSRLASGNVVIDKFNFVQRVHFTVLALIHKSYMGFSIKIFSYIQTKQNKNEVVKRRSIPLQDVFR